MNREAIFYQQAIQKRVSIQELDTQTKIYQTLIYIHRVVGLAKTMDVEFPTPPNIESEDKDNVIHSLYLVEKALNDVYARNVFELNDNLGADFVVLNEDWRAQLSSYINHLRSAVQNATIEAELREGIVKKIDELQTEVGRERTRLQAGIDTFLAITGAIGEGAKNLEPARQLIGKVVNSISRLQKAEKDPTPLLPSPDKMGLPDGPVDSNDNESAEDSLPDLSHLAPRSPS